MELFKLENEIHPHPRRVPCQTCTSESLKVGSSMCQATYVCTVCSQGWEPVSAVAGVSSCRLECDWLCSLLSLFHSKLLCSFKFTETLPALLMLALTLFPPHMFEISNIPYWFMSAVMEMAFWGNIINICCQVESLLFSMVLFLKFCSIYGKKPVWILCRICVCFFLIFSIWHSQNLRKYASL